MMTMIIQIITIALLSRGCSGFTKPSSLTRSVDRRLQTTAFVSVNDNVGGFHYEQEPRGTSYMSQISERDLYERRKMRRDTLSQRVASSNMRNTPNSRGAGGSYQQQMKQQVMNMRRPPMQEMQRPPATPRSRMDTENVLYNNNNNMAQQQPAINNEEFNTFKNNVSQSLVSMTNLLKDMQSNQNIQNTDVQVLTRRVADMTNRLGKATAMQQDNNDRRSSEEIDDMINQINERGAQETSFGTSLDGQFNPKIKEFVVDKSDNVNKMDDSNFIDQTPPTGKGSDEQYYPVSKVAQLENKINKIDSFLQTMENKFDTLINDRLDVIEDVTAGMERESFMEDRSPQPIPPPMPYELEIPPPLPPMPPAPPPQEELDMGFDMDDGRAFYQERNFNARSFNQANNNIPPPPPPQFRQQISSSQQQMANNNNSVNTSSSGHHYNDRNTSFISSFSKEDNSRRRQFNPFDDSRRRREMNNMGEQFSPPSRMMGMNDGPMMMMGEDEFMMYEDPMMDGPMMMNDMY